MEGGKENTNPHKKKHATLAISTTTVKNGSLMSKKP
jgi:hypothetical protein